MENAPTLEEKITRQPLHLTIPKFSIDFNVDLIENLRQQVITSIKSVLTKIFKGNRDCFLK